MTTSPGPCSELGEGNLEHIPVPSHHTWLPVSLFWGHALCLRCVCVSSLPLETQSRNKTQLSNAQDDQEVQTQVWERSCWRCPLSQLPSSWKSHPPARRTSHQCHRAWERWEPSPMLQDTNKTFMQSPPVPLDTPGLCSTPDTAEISKDETKTHPTRRQTRSEFQLGKSQLSQALRTTMKFNF